ncbi:metal ABC transporter substrate-binding protein [Microbulbifer thermotolerans]|uniref:metal ABC transporter substrate-binding protein n=1 Tax=Microbulbifer thermotolerans TaxID=252514 RepID=UPI00224899CE|nr:metal ABC transporter substrate-binding protein [Microbulbifer thermotolerans]MCX2783927.1 metal ABC transporter substrate-binding protein [Microbulbifer thermotolerans]MCX2793940.1 metal ABC transporter substrate-binding protein [Microbulbifer thermotolerans]WKT60668.1 metal ABC transporter substrate-binding protein [Microbulbifer thermotolerans]
MSNMMFRPRYLLLLSTLILLAACDRTQPGEQSPLVVSIRPLALIAQEIVGDDLPVHLLIENADPHHYAPSVSDRALLERARLAVWLGPEMEAVLAKQMALLPAGRQLPLLRAGGYEFAGANETDAHLWLRPRNAAVIGAHIAERLAELEPSRAEDFRRRARDFSRQMANLQKVLDRALWAYRDMPIVVTHDAYGHFFGAAGVETKALSQTGTASRGAKALLQLQDAGDGCLFGEVPENDRDRQLAEHLGLRYVALDPLAVHLAARASYRDLIEQLLAQARRCLAALPHSVSAGHEHKGTSD